MRTLWNVVSFLAVVHLMALVMFAGWLWSSGRLSPERIAQLRDTFRLTVAEAEAAEVAAVETERAAEQQAIEQRRRSHPALPASEQIRVMGVAAKYMSRTQRQLEDTADILAGSLETDIRRLELRSEALETERKRYAQGIEGIEQRKNDTQFIKAVKLLERLQPKLAKERLKEMAAAGDAEQAVAYLDAMNDRKAAQILAQFKGEDGELATELLERLRTYGVRPDGEDVNEAAPDAEPLARAP